MTWRIYLLVFLVVGEALTAPAWSQATFRNQNLTPPPANRLPAVAQPPPNSSSSSSPADRPMQAATPDDTAQEPAADVAIPSESLPPTELPTTELPTVDELKIETIESRQQAALAAAGDDEALKARLTKLYSDAIANLQARDQYLAQAVRTETIVSEIQQLVAERKKELEEANQATPSRVEGTSLAELELEKNKREQRLNDLKTRLTNLESQIATRPTRRGEIRERLAEIEQQDLPKVTNELSAAAPTGESSLVTKARTTELVSRRIELQAAIPALQSELTAIEARDSAGLSAIERDLFARRIAVATEELAMAREAVEGARAVAAQEAVAKARREESQTHPALREIAERNRALAEANQKLAPLIGKAQAQLVRSKAQLEKLQNNFRQMKNKVEIVGLSASVGAMLRSQRQTLPNASALEKFIRKRRLKIEAVQLERFDLNEERASISDPQKRALQLLRELKLEIKEPLLQEAASLLLQRRELLDPLISSNDALFEAYADTSFTQQQTINATREFQAYIDQRVLWIRSAAPMGFELASEPATGLRWMKPAPWADAFTVLANDAAVQPWAYGLAIVFWIVLLGTTWHLRRVLGRLAKEARKSTCQNFLPTMRAALITIMLSLRIVLPLAFVAWRLRLGSSNEMVLTIASGLSLAAKVGFPLAFFRNVVRADGLADAHLDWSDRSVKSLRRHLRWLTPLAIVMVATVTLFVGGESIRGPGNIERLGIIVACLLSSVFIYRVMDPDRGIPSTFLAERSGGWWDRLSPIWFWSLVSLPLFIAGLCAAGYVYTANELSWRAFVTIVALAAIGTLFSIIARGLLVYRRGAYIQQARQRMAEAQSQAAAAPIDASEDGVSAAKAMVAEITKAEDPLANLRSQTLQARRLTAVLLSGVAVVAIWFAWHDVMPALGFLEKWPVWKSTKVVTENVKNADGVVELQSREVIHPVTIVELGLALVIVAVSLIAARDLPGLAEIAVLNRLPIDKSVRYAITTIVSYLIVLAGVIIGFKLIGLRWNQIQWMATALTFGLAFGLQEMFANFVAGIIILFERPVRVGDIVTLDDVTGVISRVKIRATTITNWDRKDFIVPNKDFITGRVLNWTLTDHVNRIVINVGVAYGSDTRLAKSLIKQVAIDHPIIVDDPAPIVTFEGFGDSSLTFTLRCFIAMNDMPMRLSVVDDLHTHIDDAFRQSGVEIAFPQRDLHIRSMPEAMWQAWSQATGSGNGTSGNGMSGNGAKSFTDRSPGQEPSAE